MSRRGRTHTVSARIAYAALLTGFAFGPLSAGFAAEDSAAKGATVEGIFIGTYQTVRPSTVTGETVKNEASAAIDVNVGAP